MIKPTVLDIFCGAGGFSEGFRQQGFEIVMGIDHWETAVRTYNHNFGLDCSVKNVLEFERSIEEIEALPDTDVIIGSPPCVTFSSSNISGKADKTLGITLTQIFLKIVAVKKWKKGSCLKAWYMENVPSSLKHLGKAYTFEELNLGDWAAKNKIGRTKVAICLDDNQMILNSADHGCAQTRKRAISGEIISKKKLIVPPHTHVDPRKKKGNERTWRPVSVIMHSLPAPNTPINATTWVSDPNYPDVRLPIHGLKDHFYDTGLYQCEWRQSRFYKVNHPYMGRMSFPENPDNPSRTITATKIGTSREALILRSEYDRKGDGEYRTLTVREAACIMGFPITYQFLGGETSKWRLVGNAVCPSVARAFAAQLRTFMGLPAIQIPWVQTEIKAPDNDLNTFQEKEFTLPPRRNQGSRFRRHPFKDGNITVTLSNYDIVENERTAGHWKTSIQYGNGEGFPSFNIPEGTYKKIEPILAEKEEGRSFLQRFEAQLLPHIGDGPTLQKMYEQQYDEGAYWEPTVLIERLAEFIEASVSREELYLQSDQVFFMNKQSVPVRQLYALYTINLITSLANGS